MRKGLKQSSYCFKPLGSVNAKALPARGGPWRLVTSAGLLLLGGRLLGGHLLGDWHEFHPLSPPVGGLSDLGVRVPCTWAVTSEPGYKKRNKYRRRCQPFAPLFFRIGTRRPKLVTLDDSLLTQVCHLLHGQAEKFGEYLFVVLASEGCTMAYPVSRAVHDGGSVRIGVATA